MNTKSNLSGYVIRSAAAALFFLFALVFLVAGAASSLRQTEPLKFKRSAEPQEMLQFTSGGHVLGFSRNCVYVATGSHALRVEFVNAHPTSPISAGVPSDGNATRKASPLSRVTYSNLWDGVTLTYDAPGGAIARSTYRLEPYAKPENIRLRYNAPVSIQGDGSLRTVFRTGAVTESAPQAWQEQNGKRMPVQVAFVQRGEDGIGFRTGQYDRSQPLFIDPYLTWNTFLGGVSFDEGYGVAVDGNGNVYVTGYSYATWGSPVHAFSGSSDAFAAKLNSSGNLIWNTFLGLSSGSGIAVDGSGNVYVVGTSSANAFVAKLDSNGNLTWNTFLGGSAEDEGHGVAVDKTGNVYVVGDSNATWGSPVRAFSAAVDGFVAKLNSSGNLTWNTFLGGNSYDYGYGVAVDGSGNVYVVGISEATWGSPVRAFSGGLDAFAAKLDSGGNLTWNTFLGSSSDDYGYGVAVDGSGNVYVVGVSYVTWGSPIRAVSPCVNYSDICYDPFVAKLDSGGNLSWNTFLGDSGNNSDGPVAVAVDKSGNVYVSGSSEATWGLPVLPYTSCNNPYYPCEDAFAAKLKSNGTLSWNAFLGSSDNDYGYGVAVDASGNVYVTGYSEATWGSPVRPYSGSTDVFVAQLQIPIGVTVQTSINGLAFTVDGQTYNSTQIFAWEPGSSHTIATTSPQNGPTDTRYYFSSWSDGGAISHTITATNGTTYTAKFGTQYYLTMKAGTGGSVTPNSGWRTAGTNVLLTATPAKDYSFLHWAINYRGGDSYSTTNNPASITMDRPVTATAVFFGVTVQTSPSGLSFTVDGQTYTALKTFNWSPGSTHTIATTTPQSGAPGVRYYFSSWSDGGAISHTVTPTNTTTYTAKFGTQYYLTMSAGTGGHVSPASSWRGSGSTFSISATPSTGYSFSTWTGSGSGSYSGPDNPRSITIMGPITEAANFTHN